MRLSGGQNIYKKYGLYDIASRISFGQRPFDLIERYKKRKFLLSKNNAGKVSIAALEGWSGTTWPLQLRQPGSTPGPFAIISQYRSTGGGPHDH